VAKALSGAKVLIGAVFSIGMISSMHAAENWHPVLTDSNPGAGYRGPSDAFVIPVPADLDMNYLKNIALELDDVDVTQFVQRKGSDAVFKPVQALSYGSHHLRVVYYAPDGNIVELASWSFEVRQSRYYRQAALAGNYNLNLNHQVAQQNISPGNKKTYFDGAANMQAAVADSNWQMNGNIGLIGNGNYQALGFKRGVDVSSFLISAQTPHTTVAIGNQSTSINNLALGVLSTRGATATVNDENRRYSADFMSMRPTALAGAEGGLGVSNPDNRINAVALSAFPFKTNPQNLFLSLTYLQGKNSGGAIGAGSVGETTPLEGNAWSIVADSSVIEQQLRMRLEYANASLSTDVTGLPTPAPELKDDAYSLLTEYQPRQQENQATPLLWKVSLSNQHVGRDYVSIGNTSLPRDKEIWKLAGQMGKGGLNSFASVSSEYDNVNNDPDMARVQTNRFNVILSYTPELKYDSKGQPQYGMFGQQSYNIVASKTYGKTLRDPSILIDFIDNETTNLNISGTFSYAQNSWSIAYGISKFVDNMGLQPDTDTASAVLSANLKVGSLNLTPSWQFQNSKSAGIDNDQNILSIDFNTPVFSDVWLLGGNYSRSTNKLSDGSSDMLQTTVKASLEWNVRKSEMNKTGISLRLSGIKNINDDKISGVTSDSYQVFITGVISSPFGT
jgi:hypothetical protein